MSVGHCANTKNIEMKMLRSTQGKTRNDRIKDGTINGNTKVTPIKSVLKQKGLSVMVWSCDANGGDPRNKKHFKYEGDGNKTQGTSKDEMA